MICFTYFLRQDIDELLFDTKGGASANPALVSVSALIKKAVLIPSLVTS
ncbi:MAG: hypothetical protein ABI358_12940 [Ginsengibacter sp.]